MYSSGPKNFKNSDVFYSNPNCAGAGTPGTIQWYNNPGQCIGSNITNVIFSEDSLVLNSDKDIFILSQDCACSCSTGEKAVILLILAEVYLT